MVEQQNQCHDRTCFSQRQVLQVSQQGVHDYGSRNMFLPELEKMEAIKDRMIEDQKRKDEEEAKEMSLVWNK